MSSADRPRAPERLVPAAGPAQRPPHPRPPLPSPPPLLVRQPTLLPASRLTQQDLGRGQLHTCSPENVPPPPGLPSPGQVAAAPRWGPRRATRHGGETQSVCGPSDKPLPRPPERRRPAGGQHRCAHVHTHRRPRTRLHAHTALPPPTQGVWDSGRGCSGITVLGPCGGAVPPGGPGAVSVLKGCWPSGGPCRVWTRCRVRTGSSREWWRTSGPGASRGPSVHTPCPRRRRTEPRRRPGAGGGARGRRGVQCACVCACAGRAARGAPAEPRLFARAGPQESVGLPLRGTTPLGRAGTRRRPRRAQRRRRPSRRT